MNINQENRKRRAALFSVASNITLVVAKIVVGVLINSVAVISEAVHSGIDLLASLIAYFSIKEASKPADDIHPYGHGKFENVSGLLEAALILFAAIYIIHESVDKIKLAEAITATRPGILVMLFSAVVNFAVSRYLFKTAKETDSIALEADAWHLRTDVYTSLGIFAGLILISITGYQLIDPIVAIVVALWLGKVSISLMINSVHDIIDSRLSEGEEKKIFSVLNSNNDSFVEYHKLRSRKSGSERFIDLHLVVPSHWDANKIHEISHMLQRKITEVLPHSQLIIHIEPCSSKVGNCGVCTLKKCNFKTKVL